jgi:hypothetical protein
VTVAAIDRDVQELLAALAENGLYSLAAEANRRLTREAGLGEEEPGVGLDDGELTRSSQLERVDDLIRVRVKQQLLIGERLRTIAGEFQINQVDIVPSQETDSRGEVPSLLLTEDLLASSREEVLRTLLDTWTAASSALRQTWELDLGDD